MIFCWCRYFLFMCGVFFVSFPCRADINCLEPPQQIARDITVDTTLSAKTIFRLGNASASNQTKIIVGNLFQKYPNADRIVIVNLLLSTYCEIIKGSKEIDGKEKAKLLESLTRQVLGEGNIERSDKEKKIKIFNEKTVNKKTPLETTNVKFGRSKDGKDYDIIFNSTSRLYNAGSKSLEKVRITFRCDDEITAADAALYPQVRVSGYSDSDKNIVFLETQNTNLLRIWIDKITDFLKDYENKSCLTWARLDKYYKFSFEDVDAKSVALYYKTFYNFSYHSAPQGELSTTNQEEWLEKLEQKEALKKVVNIELTDVSNEYLRKIFLIVKNMNRKSIFD